MDEKAEASARSRSAPQTTFALALAMRSCIARMSTHAVQRFISDGSLSVRVPGYGLWKLTIEAIHEEG